MTNTQTIATDVEVQGTEVQGIESNIFGKDLTVRALKDKLGCTIKDAVSVYEAFLDVIKVAADDHKQVRLPGLGTLRKVTLDAGEARNPSTGATVSVPARVKYALKSKPVAK